MNLTMLPSGLLECFHELGGNGVIAFVGSGPSIQSGLPSWGDLLLEVASDFGLEADVRAPLAGGKFIDVANYLARQRGEFEVQKRVAACIKRAASVPSPLHRAIVSVPFAGVVTTNYDLLLTHGDSRRRFGLPVSWRNSGFRSLLQDRFMFHVHGHVNDPASIVLSRESYDDLVVESSEARVFLQTLFHSRCVLFIGFGFGDEHVDTLLKEMQQAGVVDGGSLYALVPRSPAAPDAVQHEKLRQRLIDPIYAMDVGDYGAAAIADWLNSLAKSLARIADSKDRPVSKQRPGYLVDELRTLLADERTRPLLVEALKRLTDRPDLWQMAARAPRSLHAMNFVDELSPGEMRSVLQELHTKAPSTELVNLLTCFPPEPPLA